MRSVSLLSEIFENFEKIFCSENEKGGMACVLAVELTRWIFRSRTPSSPWLSRRRPHRLSEWSGETEAPSPHLEPPWPGASQRSKSVCLLSFSQFLMIFGLRRKFFREWQEIWACVDNAFWVVSPRRPVKCNSLWQERKLGYLENAIIRYDMIRVGRFFIRN